LSDGQVTVRVQDGEYKTTAVMYRGDGSTNAGAKQMGKKHTEKHIWLSSIWPADAGARDPTTGGQLIIVQHTSYVGAAAAAAYVQHCILL